VAAPPPPLVTHRRAAEQRDKPTTRAYPSGAARATRLRCCRSHHRRN